MMIYTQSSVSDVQKMGRSYEVGQTKTFATTILKLSSTAAEEERCGLESI